jgi:hypothetical protein
MLNTVVFAPMQIASVAVAVITAFHDSARIEWRTSRRIVLKRSFTLQALRVYRYARAQYDGGFSRLLYNAPQR